jgi:pimeloyl-ACP methyl ester carboxylesterase
VNVTGKGIPDVADLCWPTGERTQLIEVDGCRIAYVEAGAGSPAVLLVHGSTSDYRSWQHQVGPFAEHYRTIAVSLRHCYPECWNGLGDDFTVEQHAADLAAFIGGKRLGPVHLIGHSRGGAVALDLALRRPELIRTLVLLDPGALEALLPETPEGQEMARETAEMFARLQDDLEKGDVEIAARHFVDALGGPGTWSRRTQEQRQLVLDNIHTGPACAQRPTFTAAQIASLAVPILVLTGSGSPPRYATIFEAMRRANPRVSPTVTLENAAHAMHRENPGAFNAVVLEFLRQR